MKNLSYASPMLVAAIMMVSLLIIVTSRHHRQLQHSSSSLPIDQQSSSSWALLVSSEQSCVSRSQLQTIKSSNHQKSPPRPSPYFLSRLRDYEQHHKRCDPHSESFKRNSWELVRVKNSPDSLVRKNDQALAPDCKYIVFTPVAGLGNRMLGMSSAFLYALLTERVLLVDFGPSMSGLFCEPFPNSTWLLPGEFSFMHQVEDAKFKQVFSLGSLLKNNHPKHSSKAVADVASLLELFLSTEFDKYDKLFYKEENQELLKNVPWLILRSNQYFLPYFFLMSCFRTELDRMFPDKEIVFHHLARYLFNPSNQAWGRIIRFYDTYLARAKQRIGLQVRIFDPDKTPPSVVLPHVLSCLQDESRVLPQLQQNDTTTKTTRMLLPSSQKAVFVASLFTEFYTELMDMYWTRPIVVDDGEEKASVGVYQASHEGNQESDSNSHNMKALVDIYLLSMCDVLVTSHFSTFGYVAYGLAGLNPWFLQNPDDYETKPLEAACRRGASPEPCFQFHPTDYDPVAAHRRDPSEPVPVIMYCEDFEYGYKLTNIKQHLPDS